MALLTLWMVVILPTVTSPTKHKKEWHKNNNIKVCDELVQAAAYVANTKSSISMSAVVLQLLPQDDDKAKVYVHNARMNARHSIPGMPLFEQIKEPPSQSQPQEQQESTAVQKEEQKEELVENNSNSNNNNNTLTTTTTT
eukprot:CAMPEP_0118721532 /NCGR_PEP_ID=MMETSP0800-20121206/30787_1 /TAXON_ID=210618 ORGANISM="Striatella unipunctata, Strain CCMP2910" /NCGR_SAMPLE_ID=MMETSP0800 /ASSEMBLY_ACC=CAM_ASM_000638 /LENGTH=139 /DNA_ID=CAMNT_0006629431 /DNA_START=108 /DNA_END=524 /DNA_ORIENTATION=+